MTINKKFALYLLLASTALSQKKTSAVNSTCTTMGPLNLVVSSDPNTPSQINLSGQINVGQDPDIDVIKLTSMHINPSSNLGTIIVLGTDTNGNLITTEASQRIIVGNPNTAFIEIDNDPSGSGNVTLNSGTSGNIILQGSNITPSTGLNFSVVQMDQYGNIIVPDVPHIFCGALSAGLNGYEVGLGGAASAGYNGLSLAANSGNVLLQAGNTGSNLNLQASQYINLKPGNITQPSAGATKTLGIDENFNLVTVDSGSQIITNLNAAQGASEYVNLGIVSGGNALSFTSDSGDVSLQANNTASNLSFSAAGDITLKSQSIDPTAIPNGSAWLLQVDNTGAVTSSAIPNIFTGSITSTNANIGNIFTLGNISGNSINYAADSGNMNISANKTGSNLNLSANQYITLQPGNITQPSTGTTEALGIDENFNLVTFTYTPPTIGNLDAAQTAGDYAHIGIQSGENSLWFTNNTGDVNLNASHAGSNLNLKADQYINLQPGNIAQPSIGSKVVLGLDSNFNLVTVDQGAQTITNLDAAHQTNEYVNLGMNDENKIFLISDEGSILLQSTTSGSLPAGINLTTTGNINQSANIFNFTSNNFNLSSENITLTSNNIINASSSTTLFTLGVNASGVIFSSNQPLNSIMGDATQSYLSVDNTIAGLGNVTLNSGTSGNIILQGSNITPSTGSNFSVVQMDQYGNIIVPDVPHIFCGALSAGLNGYGVELGGAASPGYNGLSLAANSGNVLLQAGHTGSNLNLQASQYINLKPGNITQPSAGATKTLGIDENFNLVTVDSGSQTITNLNAAQGASEYVNLGIVSGGNALSFTSDSGNVSLQANASSANLNLSSATNINISSSGEITLTSNSITNPTGPSTSPYFLAIDNTGKVTASKTTTLNAGSLNVASGSSDIVFLGGSTLLPNNTIFFTTGSGDITLQAKASGANLDLTADNYITIKATGITNPTGSDMAILGVDNTGNVKTVDLGTYTFTDLTAAVDRVAEQGITLGNTATGNGLSFINNSGDVSLQAYANGSNLLLDADNHIVLHAVGITAPLTGSTALGIDSNGNLITIGTGPDTFTNLTAAAGTNTDYVVTLGNNSSGSGNALSFHNNSGNVTLQAAGTGSNLVLTTNGNINITTSQVPESTFAANTVAIVGVDSFNNLTSTFSEPMMYIIGNNDVGNNYNYITVDNQTVANGITLAGNIYLTDTSLLPGTPGCTNVLTIDSNGKIGIQVSTITKKRNVAHVEDSLSWDGLDAHHYNYIGSENVEYGYIAEELEKNRSWKQFVIYNQEHQPMSVNYNSIFVAAMHIAKTKIEKAEQKIAILEQEIAEKNNTITNIQDKFTELETQYKILAEQIAQLKLYCQASQQTSL